MSVIAWSRRHLPEIGLALFMAACLGAMTLTDWPTVPFHFVWASLTIVFGIRLWRHGSTWVWLAVVMLTTAIALYSTVNGPGGGGLDEMTEVPLMGAIFLITVWQVRSRQHATDEMRKMAERERSLLEAQREFILDSAHSLRTPITIARGHAELIREEALRGATRADADIVIEELDRLGRMSGRMLLLVAAEHPEFLAKRRVPVAELIGQIATKWRATAPRDWSFRLEAAGTVDVDEDRLALAIDAVIENAVKHTATGGSIEIGALADGSNLLISVNDDGPGIPPEELAKVFDRFGRTRDDRGGTGLGLPIAQAIVRAHDGTIRISSHHGARVTMTLPSFLPDGTVPASPPRLAASTRP